MKRNNSLDFYRILCTIVIILWHSCLDVGANAMHGYRSVEFFFILSGFLLYRSFKREQEHSSYRFFVHRLKRLYPEYLIAALCAILVCGVMSGKFDLSNAIGEIFMTHSTGLTTGDAFNFPSWYVTCLFAASMLLYGMLSLSERASARLVLPLVVVCGYSLIWGQYGELECWDFIGPFAGTMLRALAAMSVGILLSMLEQAGFLEKFSRGLQCVLEIGFLAIFVLGLYTDLISEPVTILGAAGLILITAGGEGIIARLADRKIFGTIGKYTYSAYLSHAVMITVMLTIDEKYFGLGPDWVQAILLLLFSAAYSVVIYQTVTWLQRRRAARLAQQ